MQFLDWYEQYGFVFANALRNNCSAEYQNYLYGVGTNIQATWNGFDEPKVVYGPGSNVTINFNDGGDEASSITQPVIQCILNSTSDYIKSSMSSAQVLLGLTPTILALLGPSPMELSLLTIIAKRPGLALLLALACPSVYLSRAFENSPPLKIFEERLGRLPQWRPEGSWRLALVITQYAIVLGSLANVAVLYYQLGVRTICMFFSNTAVQDQIRIVTFPETKRLIALNWLLTPGIIIHIIFGTLVLSSLTFIGPRDALEVVGRFMVSVLFCRGVLMYEIAGVRDLYNSPDHETNELFLEDKNSAHGKPERDIEIANARRSGVYRRSLHVPTIETVPIATPQ
ncbi:hypothetical protein GQX73_g6671 [Xylaria multiplex]|uniref:Uncharacterized protein n=1 Tax=Xylaria multiplex TaxID=323545 RepID=A0A7C8IUS1_9PEZI|nr:hypothetical protein GQX73_g6671 [Xylaria multiplex]